VPPRIPAGVVKTLKKKKQDYVQQELHKFDKHVKAIEEREKWGCHHYTIC
jgi:hypothetical protein